TPFTLRRREPRRRQAWPNQTVLPAFSIRHSEPRQKEKRTMTPNAAALEAIKMTVRPSAGLTSLFFEDLKIGQHASLMRTVMDSDLHLFAAVSGDNNPIHISDDFASKTKFGQRIAHGMFTASLISALLGTRLPGPGAVYL